MAVRMEIAASAGVAATTNNNNNNNHRKLYNKTSTVGPCKSSFFCKLPIGKRIR